MEQKTNKAIKVFLTFVFLFLGSNISLAEGKLDDFEKKVRRENDKKLEESSPSVAGELLGGVAEGIAESLFGGLKGEVSGLGAFDRKIGQPIAPYLRVDLGYQNVESDVEALDGRLEVGYGPFGFQYRNTHYKELSPKDRLDSFQYLGLIRISDGSNWEWDIGLGALTLDRNNTSSGFSVSIPFQYHFPSQIGFEVRPSWSWINRNRINDYDLRLVYTYKVITAYAGYRWFNTSGADLNGAQFGASIHF